MLRKIALTFAALAMVATIIVAPISQATPASAATGSDFNPGNIISDALFYDGSASSAAQVQTFLDSKVSNCKSGYTCLKDFRQNTTTRSDSAGRCATYTGAPNERASTIIARVGEVCGISQKVLLVLLEKEQSLVTSSSPTTSRYTIATGFGCPDTSVCDSQYFGFFNQVYSAALQFKRYAASPKSFNHVAGKVNQVRFSPTAACGSSAVFIQNAATAGLYNYTPYQPNAAALANLYGTGDGCSAYGNRNFWRMYTDWYGSTTGGANLVRTESNSSVYLISGSNKFPVTSLSTLEALAPLGPVGIVSTNYLAGFGTKQAVSRALRSPGGTIYFYDAGIKLPFLSCNQLADYGQSCAADGYVQLTEEQIASFVTGPNMSSVLGTTTGSRYYVKAGVKREILDDASQTAAGIPLGYNVLTENAVSALPLGAPIVRESVFAQSRGTQKFSFLAGGKRYPLANGAAGALGATGARVGGALSEASLNLIAAGSTFSGLVSDPAGKVSALHGESRAIWAAGPFKPGTSVVPVSNAFIASYSAQATLAPGALVKTASNGTVYVVMQSDIRPISSWGAMLAISAGSEPNIVEVSESLVGASPQGPVALTAGSLYRSPDNATVYLINGVTNKIPFSSFIFTSEAGFTDFLVTTKERLDAYPVSETLLTFGVSCGPKKYVSAGGTVHEIPSALLPTFPITFVSLDTFSCKNLKIGTVATAFVRTSDGSIYQLVGTERKPIRSMQRYAELSRGAAWLDVSDAFANTYKVGPAA
ncbi:hypothetical protein ACLRGF_02710 [Mycetocola zhadangensis]|uniref:hypothetical protein n=1 Tax=Mycetocola zhadangensis TaxID=1164595 RepID=UPI003A4E4B56